ncbi:MAG: glutamate--tRNA ligase, partial [Mariprofundales bacterium]|nr:glutamate--tRNA ligase [Mariprofundales bacterium]
AERSNNLLQLADGARPFYQPPDSYQERAVKRHCKAEAWSLLHDFIAAAKTSADWDAVTIHRLIDTICQQAGVKMGRLAQPIRILISGGPVSPPIDSTLALLGREETLRRLEVGVAALQEQSLQR